MSFPPAARLTLPLAAVASAVDRLRARPEFFGVYSTCTFCHAPLGKNEALERFPVGTRLAFDQAKGRLWVVCPSCRQWNLSPLEERWEAIEEGERLYRDSKKRVATDQIGLAKLRDGTDLIRIGEPLRPEFAAWRYGPRFRGRRTRVLIGGALTAGIYVTMLTGAWMGVSLFGSLGGVGLNLWSRRQQKEIFRRVIGVGEDSAGPFVLTRGHLGSARLVWNPGVGEGWELSLPLFRGPVPLGGVIPSSFALWELSRSSTTFEGNEALQMLRSALPLVNSKGGSRRAVADAVSLLEDAATRDTLFRSHAERSIASDRRSWIGSAPTATRLAMEMLVHEDVEREALRGELSALEANWREAEEIAAIADTLTLPDRVLRRFARLRGA